MRAPFTSFTLPPQICFIKRPNNDELGGQAKFSFTCFHQKWYSWLLTDLPHSVQSSLATYKNMVRQKTHKIIRLTCSNLSHAFHFSDEVITLKWSGRKKRTLPRIRRSEQQGRFYIHSQFMKQIKIDFFFLICKHISSRFWLVNINNAVWTNPLERTQGTNGFVCRLQTAGYPRQAYFSYPTYYTICERVHGSLDEPINPRYQDDTQVWAKISLLSQAETADR